MSEISEAAERLRRYYAERMRNQNVMLDVWPMEDNCDLTPDERRAIDRRTVADAYLRIIDKLQAHCNSATNPACHGIAYEILKEMGERE